MSNLNKIGFVATALTGLFMPSANAQDNYMQDFADQYLKRVPDALMQLAIEPVANDISNITAFKADPAYVEQIIQDEKCELALTLAENMTDDFLTEADASSLTGMSPNFDQILDENIQKMEDRSVKIQSLCPFSTGP